MGLAGVHLYKGPTSDTCVTGSKPANVYSLRIKAPENPGVSAVCFLVPCDITRESCPVGNPWLQRSRLGHSGGQPWLDSVLWKLVNVFKKDRAINYSK